MRQSVSGFNTKTDLQRDMALFWYCVIAEERELPPGSPELRAALSGRALSRQTIPGSQPRIPPAVEFLARAEWTKRVATNPVKYTDREVPEGQQSRP